MFDFRLNTLKNDLSVVNGKFSTVIQGAEVAQRVKIHLQRYLGEWFLNVTLGMPYMQNLLGGKSTNAIDLAIRKEIATIAGVAKIVTLNIASNYVARSVSVYLQLLTVYGDIQTITL